MAISIAAGSRGYPARLLALKDAPLLLHASGPLPTAERWVAIVGARKASEGGRTLAERMAKTLGERGVGVVSGGALGIDASAHRGALAGGGPTIVVLPTPVHRPAPKRNWRLFGDVVASGRGALISEHSEEPAGSWSFMERNRIIAALADAVVIVEAGSNSGTRHTARAAKILGRPIAVVPWDEGDPRGALAAELSPQGATALRTVPALMAWLSIPPPPVQAEADPVLAELGEETIAIDRLATRIRMPIHRLLAHLTRLELQGRIQVLAGSRVRRV